MIRLFVPVVLLLAVTWLPSRGQQPSSREATPKSGTNDVPLTRLFFQDHQSCTVQWADVLISEKDRLSLTKPTVVEGFAKLDPTKQKLVQMRQSKGTVLVGVRDQEDGKYQSGWMLLRTGVVGADHGDHVHWEYRRKPSVLDRRLNAEQGNPAHVYLYDQRFFVANDRINGYTRIDPDNYVTSSGTKKTESKEARFLIGGGNHITLAVVDDRVGYSCWIDGGGPNKGRVDVTRLTPQPKSPITYSFRLPTGVIHGATQNSGRVFFAPAEGICWTPVDREGRLDPSKVKVHHIDLGKAQGKPRRVGAFTNYQHWVLFVTGKGKESTLMLLDARAENPKPISLKLSVKKGTTAVTPAVTSTATGRDLAFVFHDRVKDSDAQDVLEIIDLDPNGDGNCVDAKSVKRLQVGNSAVDGHFGHHAITFDAEGRFAFFTNPGDGTISALSLKTLSVHATFRTGGMPTAIVSHGGETADH